MRKALLLALGIVFAASSVFAQAGAIMLYAPVSPLCNAASPVGNLFVQMNHEFTAGATASQYMIANNSGGALLYLAFLPAFALNIGNPNTGLSVSYGGCLPGPIAIGQVLYTVLFPPAACSNLTVVPDPLAPSGNIEGVNCVAVKNFPDGSVLTLNGNSSCPCGRIVPVQETSWGQLKALYN